MAEHLGGKTNFSGRSRKGRRRDGSEAMEGDRLAEKRCRQQPDLSMKVTALRVVPNFDTQSASPAGSEPGKCRLTNSGRMWSR